MIPILATTVVVVSVIVALREELGAERGLVLPATANAVRAVVLPMLVVLSTTVESV